MPHLSAPARNLLLVTAGAVGVAAVAVLAIVLLHRSPVPADITKQAPYPVLAAQPTADLKPDASTYKYNAPDKQVSFVVHYQGRPIIVSQQPTPDQMTDIPEYYPKFISQLGGYSSFDTALGRVDLAKPAGQTQVAIINTKGTLNFLRSDKELTADDWRRLFSHLTFIMPQ
jgi:hypothetical protein